MTDTVTAALPAKPETIAHLFAPATGPHADKAIRYLKRRWRNLQTSGLATDPIKQAGLPTEFPTSLPTGSELIAARQSADRDIQAVLRREQDILNFSVLLAARPGATWTDHEHRLAGLLGTPPAGVVTGLVQLYLAEVPGPAHERGAAVRDLLPPPATVSGWWHRPYLADGFGLWDTASPPANGIARRLVLLTRPDAARQVGDWIWAPGGHAPLPRLARYLMHLAKIRYQHRVWSDWQSGADLRSEPDPGKLIQDLAALREAVDGSWRNAMAALVPIAADPALDGPFAADATYSAWLIGQLDREIRRVRAFFELAHRLHAAGIPPLAQSIGPPIIPDQAVAGSTRAGAAPPKRILVLAEEWRPRHSATSIVNRPLCQALAAAGHEVYCMVPDPSEDDRDDAETAGVQLIAAERFPGAPARHWLSRRRDLPDGVHPELIIGYGLETGPAARAQATNHYPGVAWLHIVLQRPHESDPGDPADDNENHTAENRSAEDRATDLLALGRMADRVLSIGPATHGWLERDLPERGGTPVPFRFDPGFDAGGHELRSPPLGVPLILLVCGPDEKAAKGADIAAKAIALAHEWTGGNPRWELLVRGAPPECRDGFRETIRKWIGPASVDVQIGTDAAGFGQFCADLDRASLVLVPSRSGEFSVVGMAAIAAGVPLLASGGCGIGALLSETFRDDPDLVHWLVAEVDTGTDVRDWAHRINTMINDRASAFGRAQSVREAMATRRSWADAAGQLLDAVPVHR